MGGYCLGWSKATFSMNHLKDLHFKRSLKAFCFDTSPSKWYFCVFTSLKIFKLNTPHLDQLICNLVFACRYTQHIHPSKLQPLYGSSKSKWDQKRLFLDLQEIKIKSKTFLCQSWNKVAKTPSQFFILNFPGHDAKTVQEGQ